MNYLLLSLKKYLIFRVKHLFVVVLIFFHASSADELASISLDANSPLNVRYIVVPEDKVYRDRFTYINELLQLILRKSGSRFTTEAVEVKPVPTSRNVMFLKQDLFNVIWIHTDPQREKELRPIRYPIFRGLMGWRLFLIKKEMAGRFESITSVDTLQALRCGQGHDWPDVKILKHAGFNMRTSFNWDGIYHLLAHDRIDFFPRGVVEIWAEKEKIDNHAIGVKYDNFSMIEAHIALKYPTAFYLFVTKENEALAQALELGFENAIADGSFSQLFMKHFGDYIARSKLHQRRVFTIANPHLPEQTPLDRKALWFSVDDIKKSRSVDTNTEVIRSKPIESN